MNKIPPAALTNEIAKSAAAQMAEYNHAEEMKKCKKVFNVTNTVPVSIVKKMFIGVDLSNSDDMTVYVGSKGDGTSIQLQ